MNEKTFFKNYPTQSTKTKIITLMLLFLFVIMTTAIGCGQEKKTSDSGVKEKEKVEAQKEATRTISASKPGKRIFPRKEDVQNAPKYKGDPDIEVRAWHNPEKPPYTYEELEKRFKSRSEEAPPHQLKYLDISLWKWEWRDGWVSAEGMKRNWKGAWYLVPRKLPPEPPHMAPIYPVSNSKEHFELYEEVSYEEFAKINEDFWQKIPFGFGEGEMWYWNKDHWELGPEW
jgi:hypothetical protein